MYLVVVSAPIYVSDSQPMIPTGWKRSMELLRDSLPERYGPYAVLAPSVPAEQCTESLEASTLDEDGIELLPSIPLNVRTREFWRRYLKPLKADIHAAVSRATVVHAGIGNMYQPFSFLAFREGLRQHKPTLFVRDTDMVLQLIEAAKGKPLAKQAEMFVYRQIVDWAMRYSVKRADLSMLKGTSLMDRYAHISRNAKCFHDTSYSIAQVIPEPKVESRLSAWVDGQRPYQFVYCGRLIPRKGVDESIRIVAGLKVKGYAVHFTIIGSGPEEKALRALVDELDAADSVTFAGHVAYGDELFVRLYEFDALLFTPLFEDTPRMIFDAYAAALPLFGYDIEYTLERAREDHAAVLLPRDAIGRAVEACARALDDQEEIGRITHAARSAGEKHSAEQWYRKRAEWTVEAIDAALPVQDG